MKTKILLLFLLGWVGIVLGQEKISLDKIKVNSQFIFDGFTNGIECTIDGNVISGSEPIQMPGNAIFTIIGPKGSDKYIIKFLRWKLNKNNIENNLKYYYKPLNEARALSNIGVEKQFNLNTGMIQRNRNNVIQIEKDGNAENVIEVTSRYFLIEKNDLLVNGSVYHMIPKFEFVFGTITYLARIRPSVKGIPSNWSTDLNLGIAYGVRRNFNKNWGLAALMGVSISKIKIDSLSTSPPINRSIEKVSLSPTLNILGNYKKFFVGFGVGFDWVNLDTEESKRWVYNKKLFYAIGIGINLFSAGNNDTPEVTNTQ